ncbi:MAG TPA: BadF/BadG/BcrA/BcrD ATPase family protein [Terracidiphilus sp.]|jgi:N-acetylglucosamine kinase-like BadF-type ATPase|nr:BadF/BadG/BcrA/BcrD ATPase family protein [Terracidiphilus sp.]
MAYYLAVDAGGTKADFLLAEEEHELARVRCGTIKRTNADEAETRASLEQALHELEQRTGVSPAQVKRTCIGTSGETVPLVTEWLHKSFSDRVGGELVIVGDVEIALDAAFSYGGGNGRGVLVLAGTGSNVAARDAYGAIMHSGGWGPMLADQGAGHWIGLEGLRRGFLARDEGRQTELLERARKLWDLPSEDALIEFANAQPPQRYASQFAKEVAACADAGDSIAAGILEQGGRDLAHLASLLIERMRATEGVEFHVPDVARAGSIMKNVRRLVRALEDALRARYPEIRFVPEAVDPIRGALWRAMQGASGK